MHRLLENNRRWAAEVAQRDSDFFRRLAQQQSPRFLWIGCSDSRVPANQITGLEPGEIFVHRNVSNLVVNNDVNLQAVLQYAIEVLRVEHIIICGHYGCGGVQAALGPRQEGALEIWINNIRTTLRQSKEFRQSREAEATAPELVDLACEINVRAQVENLGNNPLVLAAWERGQPLSVNGWIYRLEDGVIRNLDVSRSAPSD